MTARRVAAGLGLVVCAAAGVALVPAAATLLVRIAGWARTQTAQKAAR